MASRLYRTTLLVVYQLMVTLGVLFMPLAIAARRAGLPFPFARVLSALDEAIESADE